MILSTPPETADYVSVQIVSYDIARGIPHHGLAITVKTGDVDDSSGIFYPPSLRTIERLLKMRRDVVALYLRARLDKKIAFVCPDDDLRRDLEEELAWIKRTSRTRTCCLEEV